jgi:hypothetical protein
MQPAQAAASWFADRYWMREIQKRLTQELQLASERVRLFQGNSEQKEAVKQGYEKSLRRFTEFAVKGIVPDDLKNVKF